MEVWKKGVRNSFKWFTSLVTISVSNSKPSEMLSSLKAGRNSWISGLVLIVIVCLCWGKKCKCEKRLLSFTREKSTSFRSVFAENSWFFFRGVYGGARIGRRCSTRRFVRRNCHQYTEAESIGSAGFITETGPAPSKVVWRTMYALERRTDTDGVGDGDVQENGGSKRE